MISVQLHCFTCQHSEEISYEDWPFEQALYACPTCGAQIEEERKLAIDGTLSYFRTANASLQQHYPERSRFSFHLLNKTNK